MTLTAPVKADGQISLRGLSKSYTIAGQSLTVLNDLDLRVEAGEILSIVGASGSGKTTLLRILAGLEAADRGRVEIDGRQIDGVGRERAVIFQEPRLLPWLSVLENVSFGLEARNVPATEARARATESVRLVGLGDFAAAYPRQLSGGMAQRVGIARALTVNPDILLLDEPFGALDAMTKITMQEELIRIWQSARVTMVLVTHDLEEAVYLSDRVMVLPKTRGEAIKLIPIDLPRPRNRSSPAFTKLRQELMAEFDLH